MKDLQGFQELNEYEITIIVGGMIVAKISSDEKDVDSKSGDSYSGDHKLSN